MARKLEIEVTATGTDVAKRKLGEVDTALGGVQQSATTASRDMAALGQQWQKVGQGMRSLGTGLTVGVTLPIVGAATAFSRLGINAIESEDLFSRSFGDMEASARAWSDDLNTRLGLNAFALREQAGLLNMMFTSMGLGAQSAFDLSTSLSQVAIDMGSAFNLSTAEAMDKIRAGMTGQTEPLQRLGILLHQSVVDDFAWRTGIAETGVALTEQQKVLARYGSLLEQTSTIQGNFAATADQPANSMKALRETFTQTATEIGIALIPVITDLIGILQATVPYIKSAAEWFTNASPAVQKVVIAGTALAAALGPVLVVVGSLVSAIGVLMPVLSTVGATIAAIATGPIGLIVGAIAGLTAVWLTWGDDITGVVTSTYATVKEYLWDKLEPVLTPIIGLLQSVMNMFTAFGNLVGAVVGKVIELHIEMLTGITTYILDRLRPVIEPAKVLFQSVATVVGSMTTAVVGYAQQFYEGIKSWLLDRFTAVVDGIKSKVDAVTGFFENMYTAVVGNSFVPDMIAGIQRSFESLQTVMVAPAGLATTAVTNLFGGMLTSIDTHVSSFGERVSTTLQDAVTGPIGAVFGDFGNQLVGAVGSLVTGGINSLINIGVNLAMQGLSKLASWIGGLFGNATKGGRDDFIRGAGFSTDEALWDTLRAAGRDDLVNTALNVIGKNDKAANAAWMQEVTQVLGQQQVGGMFPTSDPGMAVGRPVPQAADGGIVPARRGGTLVNVGEAGMAEAIVPLDRLGGMGVTVVLNADLRGAYLQDESSLNRLANQMARRIPRVFQAQRVMG